MFNHVVGYRKYYKLALITRKLGQTPLICFTSLLHIIPNSMQPLCGLCHSETLADVYVGREAAYRESLRLDRTTLHTQSANVANTDNLYTAKINCIG